MVKGRLSDAERDATLGRISLADDEGAVHDADLVIEAVFEDVDVKTDPVGRAGPAGAGGRHLRLQHQLDLHRLAWPRR